ncbi:O-antigen ligase family protein [uncultured Williamsia sp.]|uniref:O-antigen ligase family protein n=1 Tax=uncultured Williamsia sp. TaxID=259311 RepID=UPI0026370645|nr:O-antigen ligase family protein [uncultured Williamsia sp.]
MIAIAYALVAVAAVAFAAVRRGEFRALGDEDRWAAIAVVLVTAWPMVWTFVLGPVVVGTPASPLFPAVWYLPGAAMAVLMMRRAFESGAFRVDLPVALAAAVSVLALAPLLLDGGTFSELQRWALGAVLLAIPLLKRERVGLPALAWASRTSLLVIALTVLATATVVPGGVGNCRTDKCGTAGVALTSAFAGNGNILGLSVALLLPFALVNRRWPQAVSLVVAVLAIGELAGSRTAMIGVVIVVAMTVGLRVTPSRRAVLTLGLVGSLMLSLLPVLLSYGDEAFSFRGTLWNQAKELIARNLVLGEGPAAWERLGANSVYDANYSPHNGWLDMTVSVGVAGVVVIVIALALKVFLVHGEERSTLIVFLCGLLGISTLESLMTPYFLGILPATPVLALMLGPGRLLVPRRRRRRISRRHTTDQVEATTIVGSRS